MLLGGHEFQIHLTAYPRISGSIFLLGLGQYVGLPVGELRALRDALTEEVGPQFLEAEVLDAHACGEVLQIDNPTNLPQVTETAGMKDVEYMVKTAAQLFE